MKSLLCGIMPFVTVFVISGAWAVDAEPEQSRVTAVASRVPASRLSVAPAGVAASAAQITAIAETAPATVSAPTAASAAPVAENCRADYRECMDAFCLGDPLEGDRCVCSNAMHDFRSMQKEIDGINDQAMRIRTEDVERVQMGTKAAAVFGSTTKSTSEKRREELLALFSKTPDSNNQTEEIIGDALLRAASNSCASRLKACGPDAQMEEMLYTLQIQNDCKAFGGYLESMKKEANDNKRLAEGEVRAARREMLDTTDRMNRGECLIAFRTCVEEKGGCGDGLENCLDRRLVDRRSHACENILDECNAVRRDVMKDWDDEVKHLLALASVNNEANQRRTCRARSWDCLEEACSLDTSAQCLTNINVAAGMCPVIVECDVMIPGFRRGIADQLGEMRNRFCQNDATKCLQEQCGANFSAAACIGKKTSDIKNLCPQTRFASCKNVSDTDFTGVITATLWRVDHAMMTGCVNHFAQALGASCGMDMSCVNRPNPEIAAASSVNALRALVAPDSVTGRSPLQQWSDNQVDAFFAVFDKDPSNKVKECRGSVGANVFATSRAIARAAADERVQREYLSRMAALVKDADEAERRAACLSLGDEWKSHDSEHSSGENKAGIWFVSATYEADLRNCKIIRRQKVCAESGESKHANQMQAAGSLGAAGAAAGALAGPWGIAIGGAAGIVGGLVMGNQAKIPDPQCTAIDVAENINM
ncbi:MAG: hypothetical protein FWG39_02900 [Alphaproteobacteria bacterium]|nr:hypothetical protein [Alphaproteobacteria bacterium]